MYNFFYILWCRAYHVHTRSKAQGAFPATCQQMCAAILDKNLTPISPQFDQQTRLIKMLVHELSTSSREAVVLTRNIFIRESRPTKRWIFSTEVWTCEFSQFTELLYISRTISALFIKSSTATLNIRKILCQNPGNPHDMIDDRRLCLGRKTMLLLQKSQAIN